MSKVICDICGTDYPETASQCPICGCANAGGAHTVAGNATSEDTGYTYVRGGRFSKSNVRKRLKASQMLHAADLQTRQPNNSIADEEFDEDELDNVSNKGLIVIVILLLLAIVAVGSYIAVTIFGGNGGGEPTTNTTGQTVAPTDSTTKPAEPEDTGVPCTKLVLHDSEILLENSEAPFFELYWQVEPENTTDLISFSSADTDIATVDANGVVTAVGEGETVITVKCGEFEASCNVICRVEEAPAVSDPTDPSDSTGNTESTDNTDTPDTPDEPVELTLNKTDFTLFAKGNSYQLKVITEGLDASLITWSSDDESIATVSGGMVVAVGTGRTTIRASYDGQETICKVSCRWEEATQPTEPEQPTEAPTEPEQPTDEPTEPDQPTEAPTEPVSYELLVNGKAPANAYNGMENSADFTLVAGGDSNQNQVTIQITNAENVVWANSNEAVCSVDTDGKVVAVAEGNATLTAEVDGIVFTVKVYVSLP